LILNLVFLIVILFEFFSQQVLKKKEHFSFFMDYNLELKIPKERVAVLIGKNGEVKKELEEYTSAKIEIDSKEGDVKITGKIL